MIGTFILVAHLLSAVPCDTPPSAAPAHRARPKAVEVSEWYSRRLTIHRTLSYATVPLFAFQYVAGNQIWVSGAQAPAWARTGHRIGATTLAGVFTVNTVTGLWNLWDSRHAEAGRGLRYMHALSMLTADAGFTYAGAKLSEQAERSYDKRQLHKEIALSSMALTVVSGVLMKVLNK
ncbi:MAG TPA: hypothetical protein VJ867_05910 [Gemmatimonadaceae bacterium]|nr:hypothetical protein [Gemmatimonadaceae bacterium]